MMMPKKRLYAHSGETIGMGPEFWLNFQRDWELWHAMKKHKPVAALKKAS